MVSRLSHPPNATRALTGADPKDTGARCREGLGVLAEAGTHHLLERRVENGLERLLLGVLVEREYPVRLPGRLAWLPGSLAGFTLESDQGCGCASRSPESSWFVHPWTLLPFVDQQSRR
jgi:hypothetical protein